MTKRTVRQRVSKTVVFRVSLKPSFCHTPQPQFWQKWSEKGHKTVIKQWFSVFRTWWFTILPRVLEGIKVIGSEGGQK